jgi:transcriptional repressor NrdR
VRAPMRDLDEVAYLRFASDFRGLESLDDFEKEAPAL